MDTGVPIMIVIIARAWISFPQLGICSLTSFIDCGFPNVVANIVLPAIVLQIFRFLSEETAPPSPSIPFTIWGWLWRRSFNCLWMVWRFLHRTVPAGGFLLEGLQNVHSSMYLGTSTWNGYKILDAWFPGCFVDTYIHSNPVVLFKRLIIQVYV